MLQYRKTEALAPRAKIGFPGGVVLGGMSQGAIFAGVVVLNELSLIDGHFVLSGFVPPPAESVSQVIDTANLFLSLGAAMDLHFYMGNDQELLDLRAMD